MNFFKKPKESVSKITEERRGTYIHSCLHDGTIYISLDDLIKHLDDPNNTEGDYIQAKGLALGFKELKVNLGLKYLAKKDKKNESNTSESL